MQHIFIIGSKGIPANYGGFETFVEKLTQYKRNEEIQYHVACMSDFNGETIHNGARCFHIKQLNVGSARAVFYDLKALNEIIKYVSTGKIEHPIIYILACRIGPFIRIYRKKVHRLGGRLYVNPDGHEWKRAKWNSVIKRYWKLSERLMIKNVDYVICDSKNIERYIQTTYAKYDPATTYIAYGAEPVAEGKIDKAEQQLEKWYQQHGIERGEYYLIVGRFVPENNYETMLSEFMRSDTKKNLVLITNVAKTPFYKKMQNALHFEQDHRIKFVGTVYDQQLLYMIRKNAYAYFHGHEVGGTNPSLLEALATTQLNLLLDVGFNREVAEDSALYWTKEEGNLVSLITRAERLSQSERDTYDNTSKDRIRIHYSWDAIVERYESLFLSEAEVKYRKVQKIAMIGHKRIPSREGGVEIVVKELAVRMVQRGKDVYVYNRKRKEEPVLTEYEGVKLIETGAVNKRGLEAFLYSVNATCHAIFGKYDVIHYHAEGPCAMIWLPHLLGISTVATIHGLDWQRAKWGGFASWYIRFGERIAAKYADRVIVLSKNVQQYFLDTYKRRTDYIANGIDEMQSRDANLIIKKMNVGKDDYILFLGRIVPEKGVHYLLEAFRQVDTDKKLIIAGASGQTDEYFEEIKAMMRLDSRVMLAGFVQGELLEELYSNCCYYVLPSDVEGMAISLLEAMSFGCNCLVSNIDENTEVVGEYAYTFKAGNVDDLRKKLEQLLQEEELINTKERKDAIKSYIMEKYSWETTVEKTLELYSMIQ